jgi:hypothetical protein
LAAVATLLFGSAPASGQGATQWLFRGSLHNWFSEKGWEIEEGNVLEQQYGLRWPAQFYRQDMQAAKALWIGVDNWQFLPDTTRVKRVVHVGPRVNGNNEFFPQVFELWGKFEPPRVFVDGAPTFNQPEELTGIDPALKADRMLLTVANTALGVTLTRKIYQFSQEYHDNYHIFEITLTNTGNIDGDPDIELPTNTVTGLYLYLQYRYAVNAEAGNCVNNSARWGINAMNDAVGPWYPYTPNDIKAAFSWHGFHPNALKPPVGSAPGAANYDNIGIPIWNPTASLRGYIDAADSTWRLGGSAFVGTVHLHADTAPGDTTDDTAQPRTTNDLGSDEPRTRNNNSFNTVAMASEYALMTEGHMPTHARRVEPTGNFSTSRVDPALGTPGGWSIGTGYGPYTLAPGQSITIAFAEGADGLTREENIRIGRKYRDGVITTQQKNDSVLIIGRDRLLNRTFRRALANYGSGYNIPQPPYPPAAFNVRSGGDRITLQWDANANESQNGFQGYRLYRATGRSDSTYRLIYQCGGPAPADPGVVYSPAVAYSYNDQSVTRGVSYYYYVTAFGSASANTGTGLTPPGALESSRFYTQTYNPAFLKRQAGTASDQIRIVPNPFILSSNPNSLRFPNEPDKIAFFNIPGNCLIRIYTELGELIQEIDHADGSGDEYWNSITSSNQVVVSGVYIVVIDNRDTGERTVKKLVVIR